MNIEEPQGKTGNGHWSPPRQEGAEQGEETECKGDRCKEMQQGRKWGQRASPSMMAQDKVKGREGKPGGQRSGRHGLKRQRDKGTGQGRGWWRWSGQGGKEKEAMGGEPGCVGGAGQGRGPGRGGRTPRAGPLTCLGCSGAESAVATAYKQREGEAALSAVGWGGRVG